MTRCECAEVSFEEIQARMLSESRALDEILQLTGCGSTCTACLPDLREYLAAGRSRG
jgi:bacterioferritin-associated ferredoxin